MKAKGHSMINMDKMSKYSQFYKEKPSLAKIEKMPHIQNDEISSCSNSFSIVDYPDQTSSASFSIVDAPVTESDSFSIVDFSENDFEI